MSHVMNKITDFKRMGIDPQIIAPWEDGRRDNSLPGHAEIWYLDCTFDDNSTLVLGFRPKSVDNLAANTDNPNVAINYTKDNEKTYYDYRLYDSSQTYISNEHCNLKFGTSTLQVDWQNYTVHIEPEDNYEITIEGKKSFNHASAIDLSFRALLSPSAQEQAILV